MPRITTMLCKKLASMGTHMKPKKSKICLSNVEMSCNANKAYKMFLPLHEGILAFFSLQHFEGQTPVEFNIHKGVAGLFLIIFGTRHKRFFFLLLILGQFGQMLLTCFSDRWAGWGRQTVTGKMSTIQ